MATWKCSICDLVNPNAESPASCLACFGPSPKNIEKVKKLGVTLLSDEQSIAAKFRACFLLKKLDCLQSVDALTGGLKSASELLAHECAYILGQMAHHSAVPLLLDCLLDENMPAIVRHEAAEALGAIGDDSTEVMAAMRKFAKDDEVALAQSCQLVLDGFRHMQRSRRRHKRLSLSGSIDPAPPLSKDTNMDRLETLFLNKDKPLFLRYRAMFALRDRGTDEAVQVLAKALKDLEDSALLRHETAFVLGQMMLPSAVPVLGDTLRNAKDASMVRHEAAEALGTIATEDTLAVLKEFKDDEDKVVAQSCAVALDMQK